MKNVDYISKEKFEKAFELMRNDIALLHRDLAYSEQNRMRWIFIIMWIILLNLFHNAFNLHVVYSLGISTALIVVYRFSIDSIS